jgi:hypothetical protein
LSDADIAEWRANAWSRAESLAGDKEAAIRAVAEKLVLLGRLSGDDVRTIVKEAS